jgi:DNA-binding NarL/FixJ family response regulator
LTKCLGGARQEADVKKDVRRLEKQISEMTEEGLTSTDISRDLSISKRTVHRYRKKFRQRQEKQNGTRD